MKSENTRLILKAGMTGMFGLSMLAAGAATAQQEDAPVFVRTEGMSPTLAAKLIDKGAEGSAALIRYLNRTRMIHQLYIFDVVKNNDTRMTATEPAQEQELALVAAQ